jgi:leucyl-tRNA synthetase
MRGVVEIPTPPADLEADSLKKWLVTEILKTDGGMQRFGEGKYDLNKAKRVIVVRGGKVMNFVM